MVQGNPDSGGGETPKASETLHDLTRFDKYEYVRVNRNQLLNAPYNPRVITPAAKIDLRKSIEEHGMLDAPVWNIRTGNIVGGHQRVEQLDMLEGKQNYSLKVLAIDVDERDEKAKNVILNNRHLQGETDVEKMVEMVRANEFDLESSGYREMDIENMAMDAGLPSELIESMFSPEAKETIANIATDIDNVIDQADALKRRKAEARRRNQPQDEDEQGDRESDDSEGDPIRFHEETGAGGGPVHDAEYFRSIRGKKSESQLAQQESDYQLTLVFGSDAQKHAFCDAMGIDRRLTHAIGVDVAESCGFKLPEIEGKRRKPKDGSEIEFEDQGNV